MSEYQYYEWQTVDRPLTEDEMAVALLVKLRDLATYQNKLADFERRIADSRSRCERRPSLMERFRKARL